MTQPHSTTRLHTAHSAHSGHSGHAARVPKNTSHCRHQPQGPPPRAQPTCADLTPSISRQRLLHDATVVSLVVTSSLLVAPLARAIGFKKDMGKARRNSGVSKADYLDLDISQYNVTETIKTPASNDPHQTPETTTTATSTTSTTSTTTTRPINSLKYYDIAEGTRSSPVAPGDTVTVHFDCIFRKIDAVSTRSARLLGANRVLAEPFSFPAASKLDAPKAITTDAGGGLFTGQSGPKPPQALSYAVVGMKVGGKRSVLVPAALGYGSKGEQEIPPNCQEFELQIEVLGIGAESP